MYIYISGFNPSPPRSVSGAEYGCLDTQVEQQRRNPSIKSNTVWASVFSLGVLKGARPVRLSDSTSSFL